MTSKADTNTAPAIEQTEQAWAVWTNTDLTEGSGLQYVRYVARLSSTARRLARGNYVQGTNCPVQPVTLYLINGMWHGPGMRWEKDTAEDREQEAHLERARQEAVQREAALQRAQELGLTPDEIALLRGGRA